MRRALAVLGAMLLAGALLLPALDTAAGVQNCHPAWKCASPTPEPSPTATPIPTPTATATEAPTPTPTLAPTPTPIASSATTPTPTPIPVVGCGASLQSLIDATPAGGTLALGACLYREAVTIPRAMTVTGPATIKGSDVWTAWNGNVSVLTVPSFPAHGTCAQPRCLWPEQVYVDGVSQLQLATGSIPAAGQFALDSSRHVVLGTAPAGHEVEVTTRTRWITVAASDVTIDGLTMTHAANDAQTGALSIGPGIDRAAIRNVRLSWGHGANVSFQGNAGGSFTDSESSYGGGLGIHAGGTGVNGLTIARVHVHDNNVEAFSPGWEAGGFKVAVSQNINVTDSEFDHNDGPGIWYDIRCSTAEIARNRIHDNTRPGIYFEISSFGLIHDNALWENGWGSTGWNQGAAIRVHSGGDNEVYGNVAAWNPDGILYVAQNRSDRPADAFLRNYFHGNTVITAAKSTDSSDKQTAGFYEDFASGITDPAAGNHGDSGRYWYLQPEPSTSRYGWGGGLSTLSAFNATPGEEGGIYLTDAEKDAVLAGAGIPGSQTP